MDVISAALLAESFESIKGLEGSQARATAPGYPPSPIKPDLMMGIRPAAALRRTIGDRAHSPTQMRYCGRLRKSLILSLVALDFQFFILCIALAQRNFFPT